ncbi:MAG TPA: DNA polymerase III subunit gamma/tau [Terriglobales bacterium]|nr:DNA polymerase III subunit gamma/tau [Terriglobales bacterium]
MSYQVLARKYRPQKFADVIGQPHVTQTLRNALTQQRIAHGYIFSGHRGIGKTTVARILAMALNCRSSDKPVPEPCGECESCVEIRESRSVDVIEIDAATNRGIDEIRELRDAARYRPARDRYKVYILDEAHQITDAAFNALLKTLEEPPGHIVFMMATTQPEDIPQTIRSRTQNFSFHAVKFDEIVRQLRDIAGRETISADDAALAMLAEAGDGSLRDALSIMDQAIASSTGKITAETVRRLAGAVPSETLEEMLGAVARNSSEDVLRLVDRLVTEGESPAHFARQLVRFLRNAVVAKVAGAESPLLQISADERARVARVAEQFSEEDLTRFLQIMLRTHSELGWKQEQRFHLELGLLKLVHAQRLLPVEELLSQAGGESARAAAVPPRPGGPRPSAGRGASEPAGPQRGGSSPFQADRARKSGDAPEPPNPFRREMSDGTSALSLAASGAQPAGLTAVRAVSVAEPAREARVEASLLPAPASRVSIDALRARVLGDLEAGSQGATASFLEDGQWSLEGNDLVIKVSQSAAMIDMVMGADARRVVNIAAQAAAGRALTIKVVPGAAPNGASGGAQAPRTASIGSARARAADDPVVRRLQEKFGAEIRTVIDQKK